MPEPERDMVYFHAVLDHIAAADAAKAPGLESSIRSLCKLPNSIATAEFRLA